MKDRAIRVHARCLGVGVLLAGVPVAAHHSFAAEYDANKPVSFTGTVTKMEWINPHSWIHVDVKKPDGTVENWAIEAGPPGTLVRAGFNKNSLPTGTEIKVNGYKAKDGALRANGRDLTCRTAGCCSWVGKVPMRRSSTSRRLGYVAWSPALAFPLAGTSLSGQGAGRRAAPPQRFQIVVIGCIKEAPAAAGQAC